MQAILLNALGFAGALAAACALTGAMIANSISTTHRFRPGSLRRWLERLMFALMLIIAGTLIAVCVAFVLQMQAFVALPHVYSGPLGAAIWLAAFEAFGFGYRFASRRRILRALDSGIAVGLH
jgi:hypothetical protein